MFKSVLLISLFELTEMMGDEDLIWEMEENVEMTCAFPIHIDDQLYDADDHSPEARISRWFVKYCGLNKTTIYVEVEA